MTPVDLRRNRMSRRDLPTASRASLRKGWAFRRNFAASGTCGDRRSPGRRDDLASPSCPRPRMHLRKSPLHPSSNRVATDLVAGPKAPWRVNDHETDTGGARGRSGPKRMMTASRSPLTTRMPDIIPLGWRPSCGGTPRASRCITSIVRVVSLRIPHRGPVVGEQSRIDQEPVGR